MKETTLISACGPDITHYPKVKMPPSNRHGFSSQTQRQNRPRTQKEKVKGVMTVAQGYTANLLATICQIIQDYFEERLQRKGTYYNVYTVTDHYLSHH